MRWSAARVSLLTLTALSVLGWLPYDVLGDGRAWAAGVTDGRVRSGLPTTNRRKPSAIGGNGFERALSSGGPWLDSPPAPEGNLLLGRPLGPTGPTGYGAFPGYGCSGPCRVGSFASVSCASATSCTAVGTGLGSLSGGLGGESLAEGWDGTSWAIEPTPSPTGATYSALEGVSCPEPAACMAVGHDNINGAGLPLAESWNGSSWTSRGPPSPSDAGYIVDLDYIQCASAKACMAVGYYYSTAGSELLPLAELWNGSGWTIETVPLPAGALAGELLGVSCPSAGACTAVGDYESPNGAVPERLTLAESWNGSSWSVQPTPNPTGSEGPTLHGVWCQSASSCTAVGYYYSSGSGATLTLAESWNGTSWTIQPTPNPTGSTHSYLDNLSCAPTGVPCEAVGETNGDETLVESWNGTSWTIQTPASPPEDSTEAPLSDVSCTSATACTAVGEYLDPETDSWLTLAERWDGASWTAQPTPDAAAVATEPATEVTTSSAVLHGAVDPDGATVTACDFEYGTTTTYGSSAACAQRVGGGLAPVEVSADVSGLTSGTVYYFRLVVTNAGGTTSGGFLVDSSSFTTSGPPAPTVTTTGALNVGSTSATLTGVVIPGESPLTDCHFAYGDTVSYGSSIPCDQTVAASTTLVAVSAGVTGLTAGTTYHYQLVATNSEGTGYGRDEVFTTTGSSPPTVGTRIPFTGWPEVALLSGEINAHGNDVLYGFEYGRSDVEEHFTGWLGHVTSTSPTSVEYAQHGLQPDVHYYARLVAFYQGTTYVHGNTVSFEITPPEPEATEAPYLQVNGNDPIEGYTVRCQPGAWRNVNGQFDVQWYGGDPREAHGNEYDVTSEDVGHTLECKVTPHELDGRPAEASALISDSLVPESPDEVVLPTWFKQLWKAGLFVASTNSGVEAIFECLGTADLPGLGEAICAGLIIQTVFNVQFENQLQSATDPPDKHYREIALPETIPTPDGGYACNHRVTRRTCRSLAKLASQYAHATTRVASLIQAFATSRNRTLIAREKNDTLTELVQQAARKVYSGLLANARAAQYSAGVAYAEALRLAHMNVQTATASVQHIARYAGTSAGARQVLAYVRKQGVNGTELRHTLARSAQHLHAFNLQRFLRTPPSVGPVDRYYDEISVSDVMSLVMGLARQGDLGSSSVPQLLADLDHARAACSSATRATAIAAFLKDAKPSLKAAYYSFLAEASRPLMDGASTADPYPACLR
jgi:hypothetical protein